MKKNWFSFKEVQDSLVVFLNYDDIDTPEKVINMYSSYYDELISRGIKKSSIYEIHDGRNWKVNNHMFKSAVVSGAKIDEYVKLAAYIFPPNSYVVKVLLDSYKTIARLPIKGFYNIQDALKWFEEENGE